MKIFDDKDIDFERYFDTIANSFYLIMSDKMKESNESGKGKEEKLSLKDKITLITSGLILVCMIGYIVKIFKDAPDPNNNDVDPLEIPSDPADQMHIDESEQGTLYLSK